MTDEFLVETESAAADNAVVQMLSAGAHFSTHLHRTAEMLICTSGSIRITVQNTPLDVNEGEYLVVFPNVLHSADVISTIPCQIHQTHFHTGSSPNDPVKIFPDESFNFVSEVSVGKRKLIRGRSTPQLLSCLCGLETELERKKQGEPEMAASYFGQLMVLLSREINTAGECGSAVCNRYLAKASLYIERNYMKKLTVSEVAQAVGVSPHYLTRLFQERMGLGVAMYLTYVRLSKSIEIMAQNPGYPLSQLALDTGFSSQQHFSKVFKEKMGVPPGRYFSMLPKNGT